MLAAVLLSSCSPALLLSCSPALLLSRSPTAHAGPFALLYSGCASISICSPSHALLLPTSSLGREIIPSPNDDDETQSPSMRHAGPTSQPYRSLHVKPSPAWADDTFTCLDMHFCCRDPPPRLRAAHAALPTHPVPCAGLPKPRLLVGLASQCLNAVLCTVPPPPPADENGAARECFCQRIRIDSASNQTHSTVVNLHCQTSTPCLPSLVPHFRSLRGTTLTPTYSISMTDPPTHMLSPRCQTERSVYRTQHGPVSTMWGG
ncbi:hypothetical protein CERZMDRAFT_89040 [Cercospora zeae-maydis SCOH1-5]|uniref:Hydrophobin n=1 Tax=Cercospora zeae-maydis SCOH1-5 TaxID=717836 RepID=A0A6A6EYE6_9PEZI|nr:hypothetical protein CERZMDRAFT_89040 [Cercospora zeae-maydis SCOH1-5]